MGEQFERAGCRGRPSRSELYRRLLVDVADLRGCLGGLPSPLEAAFWIPGALRLAHCRFEQIHPFLDGNGRTGRLLLNLILVRLGFPPAIVYKRDRNRYLEALRRADAGEPGPLAELLARAILDNLYRNVIPAVAGPARLVPLAALATADLKAAALRVAAIRGRLAAIRDPDGRWRSSRRWVDEYRKERYRRGPGC